MKAMKEPVSYGKGCSAYAPPPRSRAFVVPPPKIKTSWHPEFGPGFQSGEGVLAFLVRSQPLSVALKQSVIVEDRTGASGALAALYVPWAPMAEIDQRCSTDQRTSIGCGALATLNAGI